MATSANYLGYNTYILGTTKNILACLGIVVYNKSQLPPDIEKLSLYNINQVYEKVIQNEKYIKLTRQNSEEPFTFISNNGFTDGFDTIIYLSNSDNSPTGYTEFLNKQGQERNINILLAFNSTISGDLTVTLMNSLTQLKNNSTVNKNFIGKELYQYPNVKDIYEDNIDYKWIEPKYTTNLSALINSENIQNIFLGYGILNNLTLVKLNISKNIIIDPYEFNFTNYQLGYYRNDIVIYLWKDLHYYSYSLTKRDRFNNPITYLNYSNLGYLTISNYSLEEGTKQKILYFSGKYAIVEISGTINTIKVFNIENQSWENINSTNFLIDELDLENKITELPNILNYNNVYEYIPEISNIHLNLYEYSRINSIDIIKKVKNWFVIRKRKDGLVIYSGISKTLYCTEEEIPIIINDQIIMIKTVDNDNELTYYTIYYKNFKTYYSEKARTILENGKLFYDSDLNILICKGGSKDDEYKEYYNSEEIKIVNNKENLTKSYFSRFRRNILPENTSTIPEIIGAIDGIIFYKNKNYINYL